jgi:hypothetical protein
LPGLATMHLESRQTEQLSKRNPGRNLWIRARAVQGNVSLLWSEDAMKSPPMRVLLRRTRRTMRPVDQAPWLARDVMAITKVRFASVPSERGLTDDAALDVDCWRTPHPRASYRRSK